MVDLTIVFIKQGTFKNVSQLASCHGEEVVLVKDIQEYTVMFINIKNGSNLLQCVVMLNALMMAIVNSTNLIQRSS